MRINLNYYYYYSEFGKARVVTVHDMKAYGVAMSHAWHSPFTPVAKEPHIYRLLEYQWVLQVVWMSGEDKNLLSVPEMEPRVFGRPACALIITLILISQLLIGVQQYIKIHSS
jgi:hypothetical protein